MNDKFALAVVALFVGAVLLNDPKCRCGCRTLAEHLVSAGLAALTKQLG